MPTTKNNNPFDLTGKYALITGGGTGLGLGMAKAFIEAGAHVIITGRREDKLREACATLGDHASYMVNDVADLASIPGLVQEVEAKSAIDILVNNAGINLKKHTLEVTDEEFARIIQTNLAGVFSLTREVARNMVARKSGCIIMITSMAAMYGLSLVSPYAASKSAILGMTRVLASDLSPHGVRVNAIAPGYIESPMHHKALDADPERKKKIMGRTPMGTLGQPEDIGHAAVYLASSAAKYVTGINLPVDGGNSGGF